MIFIMRCHPIGDQANKSCNCLCLLLRFDHEKKRLKVIFGSILWFKTNQKLDKLISIVRKQLQKSEYDLEGQLIPF
jgi:hypothetical protein